MEKQRTEIIIAFMTRMRRGLSERGWGIAVHTPTHTPDVSGVLVAVPRLDDK